MAPLHKDILEHQVVCPQAHRPLPKAPLEGVQLACPLQDPQDHLPDKPPQCPQGWTQNYYHGLWQWIRMRRGRSMLRSSDRHWPMATGPHSMMQRADTWLVCAITYVNSWCNWIEVRVGLSHSHLSIYLIETIQETLF